MDILVTQQLHELFIQRNGHLRAGGGQKLGAAALLAVAVQGELGHHQDLTVHRLQATIHLTVLVLKDAKTGQLVSQLDGLCLGIVMGHTQQNQKALADLSGHLTFNGHAGASHTGQNCAHSNTLLFFVVSRQGG